METKQQKLANFLLKELGSKESLKRFSDTLRQLGIADLRDINHVEAIAKDEGVYLLTLITYHQFGILEKLKQIKLKIKD